MPPIGRFNAVNNSHDDPKSDYMLPSISSLIQVPLNHGRSPTTVATHNSPIQMTQHTLKPNTHTKYISLYGKELHPQTSHSEVQKVLYKPSKPILNRLDLKQEPPAIAQMPISGLVRANEASSKTLLLTNEDLKLRKRRTRRKFEDIPRIYKCTWNGCNKAYGTLNHLNHHITLQDHGPKRYAHEFRDGSVSDHKLEKASRYQHMYQSEEGFTMFEAILQAANTMN